MILQLTPEQQIEYARIADELHATRIRDRAVRQPHHRGESRARRRSDAADLERVIFEILEIAEHELRSVSLDDLRRGIAASIACRAAIKINTPLDQRKMEWMLRALAATDYPMAARTAAPSRCNTARATS